MEAKGTIRFTEEGFVLTPVGGEPEAWYKSNVVGESYVVIDGFKYRPSGFKARPLPADDAPDDEEE